MTTSLRRTDGLSVTQRCAYRRRRRARRRTASSARSPPCATPPCAAVSRGRSSPRSSTRCRSWPGARLASRAVSMADGRADNPGESWSRVDPRSANGHAPTDLQARVLRRPTGVIGYRVTSSGKRRCVVGEFDGKLKYGVPEGATADRGGARPSCAGEASRGPAAGIGNWRSSRWGFGRAATGRATVRSAKVACGAGARSRGPVAVEPASVDADHLQQVERTLQQACTPS